MDTFSAQKIPAQQVPVPPVATFTSSPIQELPQKQKSFRKFFNISSWIILFALLPITVLIFLSQDSIPGDLFYPVKRSLENVILAAASVSPATRAAFRTDLTEARFKEAQSLVVSKSNASGLSTFIDEVQSTQLEVTSLKNDTERGKAEEKLAVKIQEYQKGLSTLETKTEQNIIAYQSQQTPTAIPPSSTPTATPSPTPRVINAQPSSQPSSIPLPTLTIAPTIAVNIQTTPQESIQVLEQKKIVLTIRETKVTLNQIKKDLEENKRENKENREKKNEDEKKDSSNHQK